MKKKEAINSKLEAKQTQFPEAKKNKKASEKFVHKFSTEMWISCRSWQFFEKSLDSDCEMCQEGEKEKEEEKSFKFHSLCQQIWCILRRKRNLIFSILIVL